MWFYTKVKYLYSIDQDLWLIPFGKFEKSRWNFSLKGWWVLSKNSIAIAFIPHWIIALIPFSPSHPKRAFHISGQNQRHWKRKKYNINFYTGSNDITSKPYIIILVRQRSDKVNTPDILTANSSSLCQLHKQNKATIAATATKTKSYSNNWSAAKHIFSFKALVELRPLYRLTVEAYNKGQ